MTKTKWTLGSMIALASLAAAAQTMTTPTDRPTPNATDGMTGDKMMTLDADKDGKISKKEADKDKDMKKGWSKADTNKDGFIDSTEYSAIPATSTRPGG